MAALPRSFGPDVSDTIMRFAVGYPRDRMRDIMDKIVRRPDRVNWRGGAYSDVVWQVPSKFLHSKLRDPRFVTDWSSTGTENHRMCVRFVTLPLPPATFGGHPLSENKTREYIRESYAQRLQWTCDACEPVELELQRSHF